MVGFIGPASKEATLHKESTASPLVGCPYCLEFDFMRCRKAYSSEVLGIAVNRDPEKAFMASSRAYPAEVGCAVVESNHSWEGSCNCSYWTVLRIWYGLDFEIKYLIYNN